MALTLYTTLLSANGRKVVAAARHLGLDPRIETVNVYAGEGQAPDFLALNPAGKIPVLVDGELVLTESNAILWHLSEAHGAGRLSGQSAAERAQVLQWMFWEASQWQPALIQLLTPLVGHLLVPAHVPEPDAPPDWADPLIAPVLARLESRLTEQPWLAGQALSLADLAVAGMCTYFRRASFPGDSFPGVAAWLARIEAEAAWESTRHELWG